MQTLILSSPAMLGWLPSLSQDSSASFPIDTNYYKTYDGFLAGRLYLSRKYTSIRMKGAGDNEGQFRYLPNSSLNLGVGATYNWLTINLAYGFKFLNEHRADQGKTKYLDLQTHIYGRRSLLDLYGQFYKGFYIDEKDFSSLTAPYIKEDLYASQVGFNYQYMFNWQRFSARAAMLQSERQIKSAGTALLGFNTNYVSCSADTNMVPNIDEVDQLPVIRTLRTFEFGPSIGYAYTYVLMERLFVMGMLTGYANFNYSTEYNPSGKNTRFTFNPDIAYKVAAGYSRPRWSLAFTWGDQHLNFRSDNYHNNLRSGNIRVAWVYRFIAGPKLLERLKPIDRVYEKSYERYKRMKAKLKPSSILN